MSEMRFVLCEGRHAFPDAVDGAVFRDTIKDVTKVKLLEELAFSRIWSAAHKHYSAGEEGFLRVAPDWDGMGEIPRILVSGLQISIYVTGLTVALIAVLNVCRREKLCVTLWHYDRETGGYYPQLVE